MNNTYSETQNQGSQSAAAAAAPAIALSSNAMAAIGYFCGIGAIVALLVEPYSRDEKSRFHAFQALLFQGSWLVGGIVLGIFSFIIGTVVSFALQPLHLGFVGLFVMSAMSIASACFSLGMLGYWLYLIIASANGKDVQIPKLAALARQFSARK